MELLENLEPFLRTLWYIAIPTSIIFLIQTVMTFIGADGADGSDIDLEHGDSHFQVFSLRNLINFLLGFSWTGISFYNRIPNVLLVLVSVAVGCLFIYMFFVIIKELQKLAEDNSFTCFTYFLLFCNTYFRFVDCFCSCFFTQRFNIT